MGACACAFSSPHSVNSGKILYFNSNADLPIGAVWRSYFLPFYFFPILSDSTIFFREQKFK